LREGLVDAGCGVEFELLQTNPGVSLTGAMALLVELGDLSDFRSAQACCSWAGMVPGNNESAGKRMSGKTRRGNSYIRKVLCEIASAAVKTQCYFKERYMSLKVRRGHKKAIVAAGHKILKTACWPEARFTKTTPSTSASGGRRRTRPGGSSS
jgi:transposase